jgi:cell division protein FtsW (lipid II flippase)
MVRSGSLPENLHPYWPWVCLTFALLCAAAPGTWLMLASPHLSSATEIAWTGLTATGTSDTLVMGGPREGATIAWPNGAFLPEVRLAPMGSENATLTVSGGAGFLRDETGQYLNGVPLKDGFNDEKFGRFQVVLKHRFWIFGRQISLVTADGAATPVASFALPSAGRRDRVFHLATLLSDDLIQMRRQKQAQQASEVEAWAQRHRLLVPRKGAVRILDDRRQDWRLHLPSNLTVAWSNLTLPFKVPPRESNRGLGIVFLPPFRLASPLPPPIVRGDSDLQLAVTGRALPGDRAFILPTGAALASFREIVAMPDQRFADNSVPEIEILHPHPAAVNREYKNGTSQTSVRMEAPAERVSYQIDLATIDDLPSPMGVLLGLGLAAVVLAAGLYLASRSIRVTDGWAAGGIVLAIWALLIYRFLLAYRFALDPARLDLLAISGLSGALVGLAVVPGIVLLAFRVRRDQRTRDDEGKVRAGWVLVIYLVAIVVAAWVESMLAERLWPNAHFSPSLGLPETFALLGGIVFVFGCIAFTYLIDFNRLSPQESDKLQPWYMAFVNQVEYITTQVGVGIWRQVGAVKDAADVVDEEDKTFWRVYGVLGLLEAVVLLVLFVGLTVLPSGKKIVQEVMAPLAFCWVPAFLWLSSRLRLPARTALGEFRWGRAFALGFLMLLVPVFALPVAIHDAGGVVSTLSVFVPVMLVLLMGRRPWAPGLVATLTLAVALSGTGLVYLNLRSLLPEVSQFGEAGTRLLVFKEGGALQKLLLYFPLSREGSPEPLLYQNLANGLQHTWENRALVGEGGIFPGLGFGNAPTTRSQVRQDTLEFDSTYSFFVASENGQVGGILLLFLYAVPLIFVLASARSHFDIGHGVATVVAGAFFLEAAFHVLMNLSVLPFTGRSLPLLAVNSNSDLLRWALLLWIAAQAMQWRVSAYEEGFDDNCSLLSGIRQPQPPDFVVGRERSWDYWEGVLWPVALVVPCLVIAAVTGSLIATNRASSRPFEWSTLLDTVRVLADRHYLKVDQATKTIQYEDPNGVSSGGSLIEQEIARFNALTEPERLQGAVARADAAAQIPQTARSLSDYDTMLAAYRKADSELVLSRPSLFQLEVDPATEDSDQPEYIVGPNPAYNTSLSFHVASRPEDYPTVTYREGASSVYLLRGPSGVEFSIPDRLATAADPWQRMLIEQTAAGPFRIINQNAGMPSPRIRLTLQVKATGKTDAYIVKLGDFERVADGLRFQAGKLTLQLAAKGNPPVALAADQSLMVAAGDTVSVADQSRPDLRLQLKVNHVSQGALIGPAWERGSWRLAYNARAGIPWLAQYLAAISAEWSSAEDRDQVIKQYGVLSLDQKLQNAMADYTAARGRQHYGNVLTEFPAERGIRPPRVALAAIRLDGEVLGMAGWPRMSSDRHWESAENGDIRPPAAWLEQYAPQWMQHRYLADRNFDRMVVGSSSKPLWASAVLQVHHDLDKMLAVSGPAGEEDSIFGIQLSRPWHVGASSGLKGGKWADFTSYLARSDNRYQVRLGFLGLAQPGGANGPDIDGVSSSDEESMDGGQTRWGHTPRFVPSIQFSSAMSDRMKDLDKTDLAEHLRKMYSIQVAKEQLDGVRLSFWSGDENHDLYSSSKEGQPAGPSRMLRGISPATPAFDLDGVTTPRAYINLLLGGGSNMWSNVDLAGAFATCVTGHAVVAHATRLPSVTPGPDREDFEQVSERIRPGLQAVVDSPGGTADAILAASGALAWLHSLSGVQVYAKTGTLALGDNSPRQTSRLLLALIRPAAGDRPARGMVFSMVVESAEIGTATRWLGEFLLDQKSQVASLLNAP